MSRYLEGYTILVVDDDETLVGYMAEAIKAQGGWVHEAYDASQALEWLQTNHPDAMITGVVMPGMSGLDLSRQFQVLYTGTPFLVMSGGGATPDNIREARELGAYRFLFKPFTVEELIGALVDALASS